MKRGVAISAAVLTGVLWVTVMIVGWSIGRGVGTAAAPPAASAQLAVAPVDPSSQHFYLTIDTPAMLGGDENSGPAFVPSSLTLPANADVIVTISNFDGVTPLAAGSEKFGQSTGTKGPLTIRALDSVHPNAAGATRTATSVDPTKEISHTFTIDKLGLNVPIAANSVTTFTFHTGAAGVYDWRCMVPCGNGPAGWGAAMSADGFMQGKVTFA